MGWGRNSWLYVFNGSTDEFVVIRYDELLAEAPSGILALMSTNDSVEYSRVKYALDSITLDINRI